jgi:hypothetical protein
VSGLGYIYLGLSLWQRKIAKDIMDTNDSGEPAIYLECCDYGAFYEANLSIKLDVLSYGERVVQIRVCSGDGCGEINLSREQTEELIADIQKLLEFIKNE